jgi:hypothetical protein
MLRSDPRTPSVDAFIARLLAGERLVWPYRSVPRGLWYQWKQRGGRGMALGGLRLETGTENGTTMVWIRPPKVPLPPVTLHQRRVATFHRRYVIMPNGCWTWIGPKHGDGYASFAKTTGHRWSYREFNGPLPSGHKFHVDHLCRNKACVNPGHLELVTAGENLRRSPNAPSAINASKTHCKRGHEFTSENTHLSDDGRKRACRECLRSRARRDYLAKKKLTPKPSGVQTASSR